MTRLLVTGASGMVGSNVLHSLAPRFAVAGTYHTVPYRPRGIPMYRMDLRDPASIDAALRGHGPDVVLHAAALTGLDWCETHETEARAANVDGTRNLAAAAQAVGAKVMLISTDSVFDGRSPPYKEDDPTGPVNVYARSKLDSEPFVRALPRGLVVRTTLFGWHPGGKQDIAARTVAQLERSEEVTAFRDWLSSPILANDLADLFGDMIDADLSGVYHVCGRDSLSKVDFCRLIAEVFDLDPSRIRSADSSSISLPARRPRDTTLDVSRIEAALGRRMPAAVAGLRRFRRLREEGWLGLLRHGLVASSTADP